MNREDIIRMAREVDMDYLQYISPEAFEKVVRFAALVAKHTLANIDPSSFMTWQEGYEAGKQAEREACAKVCEEEYDTGLMMAPVAPILAAAIRARGQE